MSQTKKCSKCKEEFPLSNFNKDNHVKCGLSAKCKSCLSIFHKELRQKVVAQEKNIPKEKECSKCKIVKPSNSFVKNNSNITGLFNHCKECSNKQKKEYTLNRKQNLEKTVVIPEKKTCSSCKVEKQSSEFTKNKLKKDGLQCKCKDCSKKSRKKVEMPETKQCSSCKQILPNTSFSNDITTSCGLSSKCRKCKNEEIIRKREKLRIENIKKEQDGTLITEKNCRICKNTKTIDNFTKCKTEKDGYNSFCKECRKLVNKKTKERAATDVIEIDINKSKKCIKRDTEKKLSCFKICRATKDKLSHICNDCLPVKTWTKEKELEYGRKYRMNNPEKMKEKNKKNKVKNNLRRRIILSLSSKRINKNNNTIYYIGCQIPFFKKWLEYQFTEGMTWENYGKWHIDHVKPCSSFDLNDEAQLKECFNWKNQQPLWGTNNLKKSSKIDKILITQHKEKADNYEKINCFL